MTTSLLTRTRRHAAAVAVATLALVTISSQAHAQPLQFAVPAGHSFMTIGDGAHATGIERGETEPGESEREPAERTRHAAMPPTVPRDDAAAYALQKRADLVGVVTGAPPTWPRQALVAGYGISNTPTQGALMVDDKTGDVAYVQSVAANGTFTVSSRAQGVVSTRTIAVSDVPLNDVDFIG